MTAPLYHLGNLTRVYGVRCVLEVDALDIYPGEVVAIVGPSGAGKSTLLRLLNFLEPPTSGTLRFCEQEFGPQDTPPLDLRRRVTTVFQRPQLLNRSVYANVRYGLQLRGERNGRAQIETMLREVGLEALAEQPARTLSGGEAQRVALARAMALQPDVLLLDEPTANLDPCNVGLIEASVQRLNHTHHTTLVLVTHNLFQARRLAQRVVLLLEGRVIEAADTETFFTAPRDPRAAAFVRGEMIY